MNKLCGQCTKECKQPDFQKVINCPFYEKRVTDKGTAPNVRRSERNLGVFSKHKGNTS